MADPSVARSAERKAYLNVVLPLFLTSIIAYVDRVNIGYAALTMNADLGFDARMFGLGAGIFFAGYFLFEIPGALIAETHSPRLWLARIMITWGVVSGLMAFMHTAWQFYLLRFLLGVAEASLYPVMYATCIPRFFPAGSRARAIAVLLDLAADLGHRRRAARGMADRRVAARPRGMAGPLPGRGRSRRGVRRDRRVLDGGLAAGSPMADRAGEGASSPASTSARSRPRPRPGATRCSRRSGTARC